VASGYPLNGAEGFLKLAYPGRTVAAFGNRVIDLQQPIASTAWHSPLRRQDRNQWILYYACPPDVNCGRSHSSPFLLKSAFEGGIEFFFSELRTSRWLYIR
jgi:hypothetical protein